MTPQDPHAWRRPDDSAAPSSGRPSSARLVDPEDDFPSANYAGDYTTTAIPRYDTSGHELPRYPLLGEPEPLPYVRPGSTGRHAVADLDEVEPDVFADDRLRAARRRGTQHLGLMVLRVGIGAVLTAHGLQKAFGLWGGLGLGGFKDSLANLGYSHAGVLTYLVAGGQLAAGVLLVLGLFTPLAGAGALAYLTNALLATITAEHASGRLTFFLPGGFEYQAVLFIAVSAIILAGPGCYGFDAGRGWARRPFLGSLAALALGIGAGIGCWVLLNGANPLA